MEFRGSITVAGRRHFGRAAGIAARIPREHPRILSRPAHLARLREPELDPRLAEPLETTATCFSTSVPPGARSLPLAMSDTPITRP